MGVPAIFVPYPFAAEAHQEKNAQVLVEAGAAALILQRDLTPEILQKNIEELIFDESKLAAMRENLKKFYHENAALEIAKSTLELMK
jgi:UDP-N-acetylglucosamine--N-acetylmuramyl-(pentapeptide) pyrophosphoryl-undecaprenol N-acetylglucosamine transferase